MMKYSTSLLLERDELLELLELELLLDTEDRGIQS
jgi:hypothetical protein